MAAAGAAERRGDRRAARPDRTERADALAKRLGAMVRDGQLVQNRRGGFAPVLVTNLIPGVATANPEGFGFLRLDEGGDDLFLPPYEMRKVMHGDRAPANVTGIDRRGRREGSIARVLERGVNRLIGNFSVGRWASTTCLPLYVSARAETQTRRSSRYILTA